MSGRSQRQSGLWRRERRWRRQLKTAWHGQQLLGHERCPGCGELRPGGSPCPCWQRHPDYAGLGLQALFGRLQEEA